ncbi:MAG: carbohydrate ABC transporter permease, partial [Betaproteobacteria bacterium]
MSRRFATPLVNGLLLGAALITSFPLLWMLSVSLMVSGEASAIPPPLLPARASFDNYRELFAHGGLWR